MRRHIMRVRSLLVVGVDASQIAVSAKKAGYKVYAADHFGDQDLKAACKESLSAVRQRRGSSCGHFAADYIPSTILKMVKTILGRHAIEGAILASGLEDAADTLKEINDLVPIIGNTPDAIGKVRKKTAFFKELKRLNLPHPESRVAHSLDEAKTIAQDIGYPIVYKPLTGFGGTGIGKADSPKELQDLLRNAAKRRKSILIQEYVEGTPASASLISIKNSVMTLTINEQLLGLQRAMKVHSFGYHGNIVPLSASEDIMRRCREVSEKVVQSFHLIGSNGVDLVITKEGIPKIVEVNPRLQGTLECVERVMSLSVVEAHVLACTERSLPKPSGVVRKFATRLILYAPNRCIVPDLRTFEETRDIPLPGVIVEKGEPMCSIITEAPTRDTSLRKARDIIGSILSLLITT